MGDGTQTSTVDVKEEDTTSADKPSEFCREAILFMVGAFMIEAVIWGNNFCLSSKLSNSI
jgi:hypothetical protein